MLMKSKNKGVTLVELSIVLAVMGILIIVGISGRSFIDISRATATIKQLNDRDLAFQIFTSTYDCTPGDCALTTVVGSNGALKSTGIGNGNTRVEASSGSATTNTVPNEVVYAEEHLVQAQLFNRTYGTVTPYAASTAQTGNNLKDILQSAKIPSTYISSMSVGSLGLYSIVGGASATESAINGLTVSYPGIFRIIDSKIDNGSAISGNVQCETTALTPAFTAFANTTTDYPAITSCVFLAKMSS
jgi:prepilin-type N-terminal cleavage/methylation domain-containing protein